MKKSALSLRFLCFLLFFPFTYVVAQNGFFPEEDAGFDCTPTHTPPLSMHDHYAYDGEECVLIDEGTDAFFPDSYSQYPIQMPDHFVAATVAASQLNRAINLYINPMIRSAQWQPDEFFIILDLDGTITNKPHPDDKGDLGFRVPNIKDWIVNLQQAGVHVAVSSAWNQDPWTDATGFHHTCERLNQLGLGDVLLGSQAHSYQETTLETTTVNGAEVSFVKAGHVCSVIKGGLPKEGSYFLNKAFAGACILGEKTETLKRVIFIEDSPGNIDVFERDVNEHVLFSAAGIYRYLLGRQESVFQIDAQATLELPFSPQ